MNIYVDIDNTICRTDASLGAVKYASATPIQEKIEYINSLYDRGDTITYWTARGGASGIDYTELTQKQLLLWGCRFHELRMGKPSYDLLIDDKTQHPDLIDHGKKDRKSHAAIVPKGWGHEVIFVNNDKYCDLA